MSRLRLKWLGMTAGLVIFSLAAATGIPQPTAGREMGPLLEEMLVLNSSMKTIFEAIIMEEMPAIEPALTAVRDVRARLEGAVQAGYRIALPKNQKRFGDFLLLRNQMQADFEDLADAARTGQKKVVKNMAHKLLDGCVACHERFRR